MRFFITIKQAVVRTITCDYLADALREQADAIREHTKALREHSAALLTKASTIDSIEKHAEYLAASEQHRLQREGRPHVFKS